MTNTIKTTVHDQMTEAAKAKDMGRLAILRYVFGEIQFQEKKMKKAGELSDDKIKDLIYNLRKNLRKNLTEFRAGLTDEEAAVQENEVVILSEFLPAELSHDEIRALALAKIDEVGEGAQLNKVMGMLVPVTRYRADGNDVRAVLVELMG